MLAKTHGDESGGMMAERRAGAGAEDSFKKWVAVAIAALLLVVYVVLVCLAWNASGDQAEMWARKVYLLGGIEALAFAAAGWFFGREVNREAVSTLQGEVDATRGDADDARDRERLALESAGRARAEATALAASLKVVAGGRTPPSEPEMLRRRQVDDLLKRADDVLDAYGEDHGKAERPSGHESV